VSVLNLDNYRQPPTPAITQSWVLAQSPQHIDQQQQLTQELHTLHRTWLASMVHLEGLKQHTLWAPHSTKKTSQKHTNKQSFPHKQILPRVWTWAMHIPVWSHIPPKLLGEVPILAWRCHTHTSPLTSQLHQIFSPIQEIPQRDLGKTILQLLQRNQSRNYITQICHGKWRVYNPYYICCICSRCKP